MSSLRRVAYAPSTVSGGAGVEGVEMGEAVGERGEEKSRDWTHSRMS